MLKYNLNGRIKEIKRVRSDNGFLYDFYFTSFKYNKHANIEEIQQKSSFTFKDNKIVILHNGDYILTKTTHNSKGSNVKTISCNANGELIDLDEGYSIHECIYDSLDRMIEERYYDNQNNLIDANAEIVKWNDATKKYNISTKKTAIIRKEYEGNKIVKTYYYNAKNELISEE